MDEIWIFLPASRGGGKVEGIPSFNAGSGQALARLAGPAVWRMGGEGRGSRHVDPGLRSALLPLLNPCGGMTMYLKASHQAGRGKTCDHVNAANYAATLWSFGRIAWAVSEWRAAIV